MDIVTIGEVLIDLTQTGKDARGGCRPPHHHGGGLGRCHR